MQMDQFQAAFIASARELDRAVDHLREQTAANTMALQTQPWPLQYVVLAALWALTTVALLFF
jgi:hypothetical protein